MTKEEIMNMLAGRELDALVAEKVMGEQVDRREDGLPHYLAWTPYSTDMSEAWRVAEKLGLGMLNNVHGRWEAYFPDNKYADAKTAPLAICRAALLVVSSI